MVIKGGMKMNSMKSIQKNRNKLHKLIAQGSLKSDKVYQQSCVLDELILQYMKKQFVAK